MRNTLFHSTLGLISKLYKSVRFLYHFIDTRHKYGKFLPSYQDICSTRSVYLLLNGPSLNEDINNNCQKEDKDLLVVNFFANTELFTILKPRYYLFCDPCFYEPKFFEENTRQIIERLDTADWQIELFIPHIAKNLVEKHLCNDNISITCVSGLEYEGFERFRHWAYRRGYCAPIAVNVSIRALYLMLNKGYKKIYLLGADHTFFKNIRIDDNNVFQIAEEHFYGTEWAPFAYHKDGKPWTFCEFIMDKYLTFKEHHIVQSYAEYLNARIINCTKSSMIDAYKREN